MRPRRIAQRKKESPISVAPPPTLPTPVCSTVAPVVDDESPRSPTFAEQIALAADELQRSPTFEEQITECRRTLKPTAALAARLAALAARLSTARDDDGRRGRRAPAHVVLRRPRRRRLRRGVDADLHGNGVRELFLRE